MSYEVWNNIIDDCKTLYEYEKEKRKKLEKENERQKEIIRQLDIKNLELTTAIKEVRESIENQPSSLVQSEINIIKILDKAGVDKE